MAPCDAGSKGCRVAEWVWGCCCGFCSASASTSQDVGTGLSLGPLETLLPCMFAPPVADRQLSEVKTSARPLLLQTMPLSGSVLMCLPQCLQAARGMVQGERPVSADSRPSTAPEHVVVAAGGARSGSLTGLFQSPAASPAPQAQAPSFVGSSLYASEGFRFPGGVSEPGAGSLSPFPGMTANRMVAPISRPPPLSQVSSSRSNIFACLAKHALSSSWHPLLAL
jgi:hypothetical protein